MYRLLYPVQSALHCWITMLKNSLRVLGLLKLEKVSIITCNFVKVAERKLINGWTKL